MFKEYLMRKNFPFRLITFSVLILLTVPKLIQDGMFLDGILYTCVSHNLSNGIGTFWSPVFSPSYFNAGSPFFQEHPPLVFGIQSLFFRLLGDSMYVERFYTFLTMCITAFLTGVLWRTIFEKEEEMKKLSWLPVLFWITIPSCSWSYSNNMMENTMGIFTISAVIIIFKSVNSDRNKFIPLIISGVFVFLATMSKGVTGFFPVALPFLYWIIFRKKPFLNVILQTLLIISVPAVLYLILFNLPQSQESLSFYLTRRLLGRINDDPTVGNRFYILKRLLTELVPQISLTLLIILVTKLKKVNVPLISNITLSALFFATGLAATVPMTLTMVRKCTAIRSFLGERRFGSTEGMRAGLGQVDLQDDHHSDAKEGNRHGRSPSLTFHVDPLSAGQAFGGFARAVADVFPSHDRRTAGPKDANTSGFP